VRKSAHEDGAVVVPASLAAVTFNALVLHLADRTRADGGELSPDARSLLYALHRAASGVSTVVDTAPSSSEGSDVADFEILGAHEVAGILGCSRRWATALLGSGRLDSRRVGRAWVTTRGDLDAYRYGREEEPDGEAVGEVGQGRNGTAPGKAQDAAAAAE
jgi:hypothetical protein